MPEDLRRECAAFVSDAEDGTPYQLPVFADWHRGTEPGVEHLGYVVAMLDGRVCFFGSAFARGDAVLEFPHGPVGWGSPRALEGLEAIVSAFPERELRMAPYLTCEPALESVLAKRGFCDTRDPWYTATVRIRLRRTDTELLSRMHGRARHEVRRAEEEGLIVSKEESDEAVAAFVELHNTLARERGFGHVDRKYVRRALRPAPGEGGSGALFLLREPSGTLLGGALVLATRRLAWYQKGASRKGPSARTQFLHWHIVRWARETGREVYDLGGIRPEDPSCGVSRFKLGLDPRPCRLLGKLRRPATTPGVTPRPWR
jgi:GNAT acetyltransferase-like protein